MVKKIIIVILHLIVGCSFIFSAYVKLLPIEIFEFTIAETGFFSWSFSAYLARLIIGFELFLGLMLVFKLLSRITIIASFATVVGFTLYLIGIILFYGNQGNCNCFGIHIILTPLESITKNIILLALISVLYIYSKKTSLNRLYVILSVVTLTISLSLPFILNPLRITGKNNAEMKLEVLDFDVLYEDEYEHKPNLELREGKWLIMFSSASCKHCINAAYKIQIIKNRIPNMPVYFFINGDEDDIEKFHKLTNSKIIPYSNMPAANIIYYTQGRLPAVFLIYNQIIEESVNYYDINETMLLNWLNE